MVREVSRSAKVSAINQFRIGDIFEICFEPKVEPQEWHRCWNLPIRDNDDIKQAREIVATEGSCLGWGSAAVKDKWAYRSRTPEKPEVHAKPEIEHFWMKDGRLIGSELGKLVSTIKRAS